MAERKRRLIWWLLPRLLIFAAGVAVGYYARTRELDHLQEVYEQTVSELQRLKENTEEMIERGRAAGESLKSGAEAAVDSTKSAVESMKGGEKN
jgi:hypothetical protein